MLAAPLYSLLVSEVSALATSYDLGCLFECYGPLLSIEMKEAFGNSSLQATVSLSTFEGAELARIYLDGFCFLGRSLQVTWLHRPSARNPHGGGAVNSIYVRHCTPDITRVVSRDEILRIFCVFGLIETVIMKPSSFDQRTNMMCGYCFVHFSSEEEGVAAALRAVQAANHKTALGLGLHVELSRQLIRQLEGGKSLRPELAPRAALPALAANRAFPARSQSWKLFTLPTRLADEPHGHAHQQQLGHSFGPFDWGGFQWDPSASSVPPRRPLLELEFPASRPPRSLLDVGSEQARPQPSGPACFPHPSIYDF